MKIVLAFLASRFQRRVLLLSSLTFALGVFLAMIPGFLGCVNWWWLRWTVLLEPIWLIGDLIELNFDPYTWVMHLFCCLLWVSAIGWFAQVSGLFRSDKGEFYDTKDRSKGSREDLPPVEDDTPWGRLVAPPILFVVLVVLIATDLPLRISFALHRDALTKMAEDKLQSGAPGGRYESTDWVGIYPVDAVGINREEKAAFTETGYTHFFSHSVYGGFVYKGNVKSEDDEQKAADLQLDDNWQAYRRGGGRGMFKKLP